MRGWEEEQAVLGFPCGVTEVGTERSAGLQEYFAGRTLVHWLEVGSRRERDVDRPSRIKA